MSLQESKDNKTQEFRGKTALITGGTKGLGLATARSMAQEGAALVLTYRSDEAGAAKAVEEIERFGVRCKAYACDLAEEGSVDRLFDQLTREYASLDFYIHNAAATSF